MASAYLTPVKDSTISSFDRYIFSLFKKVDNSPTAGPNTVKIIGAFGKTFFRCPSLFSKC